MIRKISLVTLVSLPIVFATSFAHASGGSCAASFTVACPKTITCTAEKQSGVLGPFGGLVFKSCKIDSGEANFSVEKTGGSWSGSALSATFTFMGAVAEGSDTFACNYYQQNASNFETAATVKVTTNINSNSYQIDKSSSNYNNNSGSCGLRSDGNSDPTLCSFTMKPKSCNVKVAEVRSYLGLEFPINVTEPCPCVN